MRKFAKIVCLLFICYTGDTKPTCWFSLKINNLPAGVKKKTEAKPSDKAAYNNWVEVTRFKI